LLDITGKELLRTTKEAMGSGTMRIDLSQKNIIAGVYLLELIFNNENTLNGLLSNSERNITGWFYSLHFLIRE